MESYDTISNIIDQETEKKFIKNQTTQYDENKNEQDLNENFRKNFDEKKQKFIEFLLNNNNNKKEPATTCNDGYVTTKDKIHSNKQNRKRKPIKNENIVMMFMNTNDDNGEIDSNDEFDYKSKHQDEEMMSSSSNQTDTENETNNKANSKFKFKSFLPLFFKPTYLYYKVK